MRQVNRSSVTFPIHLRPENLTETNKAHLLDHKKISNAVYRHQDVKDSLKDLYFEKCYICECDVENNYKVEHYLPKEKFPKLGYTWNNLHKSCEGCNLAKEHKDFFVKDGNGQVIDIDLLDPSNPDYSISDYMRFNINSEAEFVTTGTDPIVIAKAKNTIKYLNGQYKNEYGKTLKYQRSDKSRSFLIFFNQQITEHKELIISLHDNGIVNYVAPTDVTERRLHLQLCQRLIKLEHFYLGEKAPFSVCTRVSMTAILEILYSDLFALTEKMRAAFGI